MKRQFLSICRMFLPTHLRLSRFSCQGNVTRGCCDSQKNWSGCYLQIESIVLSYKMWCLMISAPGSAKMVAVTRKGIWWVIRSHREAHAPGMGKLACEQRGKGALLFMDWGIAVSPPWSGHTHTHMQAYRQAGSVEWLKGGSQPSPYIQRATSDLWGIPAVWALMDTTGHFCCPLLGTATSKQRCEVQQVGYPAASMRYLSCYKLPFFFPGEKYCHFFFHQFN